MVIDQQDSRCQFLSLLATSLQTPVVNYSLAYRFLMSTRVYWLTRMREPLNTFLTVCSLESKQEGASF